MLLSLILLNLITNLYILFLFFTKKEIKNKSNKINSRKAFYVAHLSYEGDTNKKFKTVFELVEIAKLDDDTKTKFEIVDIISELKDIDSKWNDKCKKWFLIISNGGWITNNNSDLHYYKNIDEIDDPAMIRSNKIDEILKIKLK